MVREYIGARYVPKFMGTYDATQQYEALCVVDNGLGTSYITKIPTPANTPLTNTTYWAIYGASSGAIIHLQNQIDDITSDITTLTNTINRKFALIGDSYVDYPTQANGYGALLKTYTGRTEGVDFFTKGVPGASFGGYIDSYATGLTYLNSVITDKDSITDFLVIGGINDRNTPVSDILSNGATFLEAVKSSYPNAKIHLGCVGWCGLDGQVNAYFDHSVEGYKALALQTPGVDYIENSEYILNNYSYLDSDDVHPTAAGAITIARGLANWIKNGTVNYGSGTETTVYTHNPTIISSGDIATVESVQSEFVSLYIGEANITFSTSVNNGNVKLGTNAAPKFMRGLNDQCAFVLPATIVGDATIDVPQTFFIQNGEFYWVNRYNAITAISFRPGRVVIPKRLC